MSEDSLPGEQPRLGEVQSARLAELPDDVRERLPRWLAPGEYLAAFLYADILPDGSFGERWVLLTNRRVMVLGSPDGKGAVALEFELPLAEVDSAATRSYIGSAALILTCRERAHELARYCLGSQHEALDL